MNSLLAVFASVLVGGGLAATTIVGVVNSSVQSPAKHPGNVANAGKVNY